MSPKLKITFIVLVALLLGAITAFVYFQMAANQKKSELLTESQNETQNSVLDQAKNSTINSFSIQGTVTVVADNTATFQSVILQNGTYVHEQKSFAITSKFPVQFETGTKLTSAKSSDIKVGSTVVVYTRTYPLDQQSLTPYLVMIIK